MKRRNVNNMRLLSWGYIDFELHLNSSWEYSTGIQITARGTNWELWLVVVLMNN